MHSPTAAADRWPVGHAAIDRYLLPAGPTAANPPSGVQGRPDGTDRQTGGR